MMSIDQELTCKVSQCLPHMFTSTRISQKGSLDSPFMHYMKPVTPKHRLQRCSRLVHLMSSTHLQDCHVYSHDSRSSE